MRKLFLANTIGILLVTTGALAQSTQSGVGTWGVGTWKMDLSQSDFRCEPAPKSATVTILENRSEKLSWRVHLTDAQGKANSYSWSGPKDGSMHPVMENGKVLGQESAKEDGAGALLRHGEFSEGESFDSRSMLSADGNTITDEITDRSKDGKVCKEKNVYQKASRGAQKARTS